MPETTHIDFTQPVDDSTQKKLIAFFAEEKIRGKMMWVRKQEYFFYNGDSVIFDQFIFQRDRKAKKPENTNTLPPGVRYEIISNNKVIGDSTFGIIYPIEYTMCVNVNSVTLKKNGTGRVVKTQRYDLCENTIATLTNDYSLQKIVNKLHIKKPLIVDNQRYTVMDFASGINLSQILEEDASGENTLASEKRVALSIALLEALYKQPTANKIIHKDLCPSNIIVDLTTHPIDVTIIDYKNASYATQNPEKISGNLYYTAPEIVQGQIATFKTDVFSLGRILAQLWRIDDAKPSNLHMDNKQWLILLATKGTSQDRLSGLFSGISDLTGKLQQEIKAVLSGMLRTSSNNRLSIQQAIEHFPKLALSMTKKITIDFNDTLENDTVTLLHAFFEEQSQRGINVWIKDILYSINNDTGFIFTNSLVARKRKNAREGLRYEVISNDEKLGAGGFGDVFSIEFTIKFEAKNIIKKHRETNSNMRVIKIQMHDEKNPVHKVQNEYILADKAAQLHIKPPVLGPNQKSSFTIMDKAPGNLLSEIIKADYNGTHILSTKQRYDLSRKLLISLNEHVTQKGIIHRDLKPKNIIVDLDESIKITVIDYGLSRLEKSEPDHKICGTRRYIAPETGNPLAGKVGYKTDVYSMARILNLIWRIDINVHNNAEYFMPNYELNKLFNGITDLNNHQKIDILKVLHEMLYYESECRCTIEEAIRMFPQFEDKNISKKTDELKIGLLGYAPLFFHQKEQKPARNQESFNLENISCSK